MADSRWYPGSGIYRDVWLTVTHPVHVSQWGNYVTTPRVDRETADVTIATEVTNQTTSAQNLKVVWQILGPDGKVLTENTRTQALAAGKSSIFTQWQKVAHAQLWSLDSPVLYTAVSQIFLGGEMVDETRTPFGIRRFYFDPNTGFFLNGQSLKLKGLCIHHDAGSLGAAVPEGVLERRLRLMKDMGCNAIRCSHNPEAPEFYDLCDRLGLLVMDEAFDEWEMGKRKWIKGRNVGTASRFGYNKDFDKCAERDCEDMVRRDRNHPCIILWSIGNEIDYQTDPYVHPEARNDAAFKNDPSLPPQTRLTVVAPRLIAAVKRQDPTRPVTMALANMPASDGTGLANMLDAVGYNYQEDAYQQDHRLFPARIIYGSENSRGLDQWRAVVTNQFVSGQFLWTGFDYLGEAGPWPNHGSSAGLFDTCGFLKPAGEYRRALWSTKPMVYLAVAGANQGFGRRRGGSNGEPNWNWQTNQSVTATVFSNCGEVELLVNGRSLGTKPVGEDCTAPFRVPFEPGVLRAVGRNHGQEAASAELKTAGEAAGLKVELDEKILKADGTSIAHAVISVVDAQGNPVYQANPSVTVAAEGAGRLLGLDNGDLMDTTALDSPTKHLARGKALAIVQANRQPGELRFTATSPGLAPATVTIKVQP